MYCTDPETLTARKLHRCMSCGETEEEAIQDAIKKSAYPTDDGWQICTREWIDEQTGRFSGVVGVGLYFSEDDEDA